MLKTISSGSCIIILSYLHIGNRKPRTSEKGKHHTPWASIINDVHLPKMDVTGNIMADIDGPSYTHHTKFLLIVHIFGYYKLTILEH